MYSDHASAKADADKRLARVGKGGTSGWQIFQGATASGRKTAWFAGNPHTDNADGPFGSKRQAEEYAKHYDARGGGKQRHAPRASRVGALAAAVNRLTK